MRVKKEKLEAFVTSAIQESVRLHERAEELTRSGNEVEASVLNSRAETYSKFASLATLHIPDARPDPADEYADLLRHACEALNGRPVGNATSYLKTLSKMMEPGYGLRESGIFSEEDLVIFFVMTHRLADSYSVFAAAYAASSDPVVATVRANPDPEVYRNYATAIKAAVRNSSISAVITLTEAMVRLRRGNTPKWLITAHSAATLDDLAYALQHINAYAISLPWQDYADYAKDAVRHSIDAGARPLTEEEFDIIQQYKAITR